MVLLCVVYRSEENEYWLSRRFAVAIFSAGLPSLVLTLHPHKSSLHPSTHPHHLRHCALTVPSSPLCASLHPSPSAFVCRIRSLPPFSHRVTAVEDFRKKVVQCDCIKKRLWQMRLVQNQYMKSRGAFSIFAWLQMCVGARAAAVHAAAALGCRAPVAGSAPGNRQ